MDPKKVSISTHELEVLRKAADGFTTRQIANELNVSEKSISTTQKELLLKIGEANVLRALQAIARRGFELKENKK